jgi:hypothetical protein
MIESPYTSDVFSTKTLFLTELAPGTDKYGEVMFTKEQWIQLRDLAESFFMKIKHRPGCDCKERGVEGEPFVMPVSDADEAHLPQFKGEFSVDEIEKAYRDYEGEAGSDE